MIKGKRYLIVAEDHPWHGHTGVLGEELSKVPGMFRLELDNGFAAGVRPPELEAV